MPFCIIRGKVIQKKKNERKYTNSFNYHVNVRLIIAVDSTYEGFSKKHTKKENIWLLHSFISRSF